MIDRRLTTGFLSGGTVTAPSAGQVLAIMVAPRDGQILTVLAATKGAGNADTVIDLQIRGASYEVRNWGGLPLISAR